MTKPVEDFAEKYLEAVNAWHRFRFFAALIGLDTSAVNQVERDIVRHGAETFSDMRKAPTR